MAQAQSDLLQHREIEIDRVPARDDVEVELADSRGECVERRVLVDTADRLLRHRPLAAVDNQYFVESRRIHRDREQPLTFPIGLDVERQHARGDSYVGRTQHWIVEDPGDALAGSRGTLDLAAALDAALDQVAHGEAYIGLESIDASGMQSVAQRWHIGWYLDFDTRDLLAGERATIDEM